MVDVDEVEYYCRECDITFVSQAKVDLHSRLYHENLPKDGTLKSYILHGHGEEHDFVIENLQCPKQCHCCYQIIWEVAVWCPNCKVRSHRSCSDQVPKTCPKASPKYFRKPKDNPGPAKNLTDLLRRKVCENKMRYIDDKYDLDFSYISPRIIAMSFPSKGVESVYRNKLNDVAELLESKHRDNYLIINVSDRTYDISLFKNQVLEFGWPDHHAPPMNTLCCIVKTMDSWLREDPNHVVVCHCKGGKGRTGVAIAAYIQFNNICLTAEEALDKFAVKRFYDETLGGVTQPSQRRMVHYFSSLIKNEVQLENRQLVLNTIILFGCPTVDGRGGAKICFCVYEGFKHIFTTSVYGVTPDREHVYISLDNLKVQSDVMIKAFHISKTGKTCILRVQFHTAFVKNDYSMVFRKKDIDIACKDDKFPDDGVLQLIFKPRSSVVTDSLDSSAHQALITDVTEAKKIEDMSKDLSLMSFEYADFSSFFTDNPLSEMKQSAMLDKILTLHDDYKLITPLQPFPLANVPPPLPPKGKTKDTSAATPTTSSQVTNCLPELTSTPLQPSNAPPALPPRKFRPPPIAITPNANQLIEDHNDVDYLSFEVATPVRNLVEHFEREDELKNFDNWVKFDDDDDKPLIDLSVTSPVAVQFRRKSSNISNMPVKAKLLNTRSDPVTVRDHAGLEWKSKSLENRSGNKVSNNPKRSSSYIPYVERKESLKRDKGGHVRYIPYKVRTDSLGTSSPTSSTCSSSPAFLSPPPLPPRGDKAAPGPSLIPGSPLTKSDEDLVASNMGEASRPMRLPSLSKSMEDLPVLAQRRTSTNKVPLIVDSPECQDPKTVEYSLINWEKVQLKKVIKQTKHIWYRPDISRQESQATLVSQCPGAFIIRLSQTLKESYGLTIRLEDGKRHEEFNLHPGSHKVSNFLIQKNPNGNLFINGYGSVDFECLEELVEFFTGHTGGLPHPLKVPTQPYADRIDSVVPMLLRNVSFPVFILEKRCIRYLPLTSFAEDNVKTLLTETIALVQMHEIRLISMSVTKHGIVLTDPDCILFDSYSIPYKKIRNCEVGSKGQTVHLPSFYHRNRANTPTFGLIHRDNDCEIIYIALAEYEDTGLSITKTINKFRSYLV